MLFRSELGLISTSFTLSNKILENSDSLTLFIFNMDDRSLTLDVLFIDNELNILPILLSSFAIPEKEFDVNIFFHVNLMYLLLYNLYCFQIFLML